MRTPPWGRLGVWLLLGVLAGAALLIVAEFTTLYTEQISTASVPMSSASTGSHDSYALMPIAVLVAVLGFAVLRTGSRPALLAVGIAGLVALLIALLGDLPDASSSGNLPTLSGPVVAARTTPGAGMYLETAGAVVLIATCGLGFLLIGPPQPPTRGGARSAVASDEAPAGRRQSGS